MALNHFLFIVLLNPRRDEERLDYDVKAMQAKHNATVKQKKA
jgi:hypothetical protein